MPYQPTYEKILEAHSTFISKSPRSLDEFEKIVSDRVKGKFPTNFAYSTRDDKGMKIRKPCKRETIAKNLGFFQSLNILKREPDFGLTDKAKAIRSVDQLDEFIEFELLVYMEKNGFPLKEILKYARTNALATPDNLFKLMRTSRVSERHFKQCLSLLNRVSEKITTHHGVVYRDPEQPSLPGI